MSSISAGTTSTTTLVHSGDTTGSLVFKTNDTGSGGTTAVTIDTSQNVGIGTTSPIYKLNVKQPNNTSIGSLLGVTSSADDSSLSLGYRSDIGGMIVSATYGSTGSYQPIYFRTSDANRAIIDTSGNLLINRTNLYNSEKFGVTYSSNTGACAVFNDTNPQSGNTFLQFRNGGTLAGSITSNGTTTMTYGSASDYRLKKDIVLMTGALSKIALLKPRVGKWIADDSEFQGFIAHELQEVFADAVVGEKDKVDAEGNPEYQMIDTGSASLIATLTAAIQELKAQNDALTARIVALEAK